MEQYTQHWKRNPVGLPPLPRMSNIYAMDGFLSGVAVSPEPLRPYEWLDRLFEFDSTARKPSPRLCLLLQQHAEALRAQCWKELPTYRPFLETHPQLRTDDLHGTPALDLWCRGFTVATGLSHH